MMLRLISTERITSVIALRLLLEDGRKGRTCSGIQKIRNLTQKMLSRKKSGE